MPWIPVSIRCRLQTAECRVHTGYKMQTKNLKCFFVWYVITCHLTTYWALRNRFSAISFHDYLHYCGIFLARFLIKIVLNINFKPSYSLLTLHASWLVWCLYRFYQLNKSRCRRRSKWDVTIKYFTRALYEKRLTALHAVRNIIFLSDMCLFCCQKCGPRRKLFLWLDIFSKLADHIILTYLRKSLIPDNKIK